MEAISEVQAELCAINARIEEVTRKLSDLQPIQENRRGVDFSKIQTLGTRYPIANHCLGSQPEAIQRPYMLLLTGLLLTESVRVEDGWLLLQRIAASGGVTRSLTDFQVDAATLTPEELDRFSIEVSQAGLTDALLLDGLLLCLTIGGGQSAGDYLAGLVELFCCPLPRLRELTSLAVSIARGEETWEQLSLSTPSPSKLRKPSTLEVSAPVERPPQLLFPMPSQALLVGNGKTPVPQELYRRLIQSGATKIVIRDARFSGYPLKFAVSGEGSSLTLENCIISATTSEEVACFLCRGFEKLTFQNCLFQNLSAPDYTFVLREIGCIWLQDTKLIDISATNTEKYPAAIYMDCSQGTLENLALERIFSPFYWYYGLGKYEVRNCTYQNCQGSAVYLPTGFQKI